MTWGVLCAVLAQAPAAVAQPGAPLVVLVSPPAEARWPAAEERARRETMSLGFAVSTVDGQATTEEEVAAELEAVTVEHGAVAAVRLWRQGGRAVAALWCPERAGGERVHRRVEVPAGGEHQAKVLGLRVAEALNVGLFDLVFVPRREAAAPSTTTLQAPGVDQPVLAPPPLAGGSRLELDVAVGGAVLPGEGSVSVGPRLGASWRLERRWSVGLKAFVSGTGSRLRRADATATVRAALAQAEVALEPWPELRLSPAVFARGGALAVWAVGQAPAPDVGLTDGQVAGLGCAGVALGLRVSERLRVRASAEVGLAFPSVAIAFGSTTVARVGRPLFDASVGVGIAL